MNYNHLICNWLNLFKPWLLQKCYFKVKIKRKNIFIHKRVTKNYIIKLNYFMNVTDFLWIFFC